MNIKNYEYVVLDSSALIAVLADENCKEDLLTLLPKSIISTVNMAEVAKYLIENKNFSKQEAANIIFSLLHDVIPFDSNMALISAEIVHQTKTLGLSLGDRACIALAIDKKCPIYTADKIWSKLKLDCPIFLIR